MILRRVIAHFRKQEWTAIAIDFLIVVGGVFVGLQVSNWNEARVAHESERAFIEAVRDAIGDNAEGMRSDVALLNTAHKFGARALVTLDADESCAENCWSEIVDFFLASQWLSMKRDRTVFNEIERTGLPRDRALKAVITRYFELQDQIGSVATSLPAYREIARSVIPAAVQDYYWNNCFHVEGRQQFFDENCPSPISEAEARAIVEALRAEHGLKGSLNFWLSTVSLLKSTAIQQIAESEKTVAIIDGYLKGEK